MRIGSILYAGSTPASGFARQELINLGISVSDCPASVPTHLLLDVPSFTPDGSLRSGHTLSSVLDRISPDTVIIGGMLNHPAFSGRPVMDLLKDPVYVSRNAAITAHCAVKFALQRLSVTLQECPVLILGWGRIGKCLAQLLRSMGAAVTVAARKPEDRALLQALGYSAADPEHPEPHLEDLRILFNTAPASILTAAQITLCPADCLKIELSSLDALPGSDILIARGLPGFLAPESSGKLIAETILRLAERKESLL